MQESTLIILTDADGEIYAYYERFKDKKIIEGFERIPYTPETLLEDFLDGFSGHSNYNESNKESVICMGAKIDRFLHGYFYDFEKSFNEVARIYANNKQVCISLNNEKVSYKDILFFNEMLLGARGKNENFEFWFNVVNKDDIY